MREGFMDSKKRPNHAGIEINSQWQDSADEIYPRKMRLAT